MTQKEKVLRHLYQVGSITPLQALGEYSIMRLAAVIHTLRDEGYRISTTTVKSINRFGEPCSYAKYNLNRQC